MNTSQDLNCLMELIQALLPEHEKVSKINKIKKFVFFPRLRIIYLIQ
jgi:hypothetical protein